MTYRALSKALRRYSDSLETYLKSYKGKRGPSSATAYSLGSALRRVQIGEDPSRVITAVSGLHALIAGGYYVDLIGTLGIALIEHNTATVRETVQRFTSMQFGLWFATPGLTGRNSVLTVISDFEMALFCGDGSLLWVPDEAPFEKALESWTKDRDVRRLPRYFDLAIYCFCSGDVVAGIELIELAAGAYLRPYGLTATFERPEELVREAPLDVQPPATVAQFVRSSLKGLGGEPIVSPQEVFFVYPE